jgi:hypothetical protein
VALPGDGLFSADFLLEIPRPHHGVNTRVFIWFSVRLRRLKLKGRTMRNGKSFEKSPKRTSKGNAARRRSRAKQIKGKK